MVGVIVIARRNLRSLEAIDRQVMLLDPDGLANSVGSG